MRLCTSRHERFRTNHIDCLRNSRELHGLPFYQEGGIPVLMESARREGYVSERQREFPSRGPRFRNKHFPIARFNGNTGRASGDALEKFRS